MFRLPFLVSLLAVCLAGFSVPLCGQCQEGVGIPTLPRIQGYLQHLDETPIAGVKIEMLRINPDGTVAETVRTETTDKKGYFRFKRDKDQVYKFRIAMSGRKLEDVRLRQGSTAMFPGGGLMNFVLIVDDTPCVGISLTK